MLNFQEFSLSVLKECLSLGASRSMRKFKYDCESLTQVPSGEEVQDPLLKASQLTLSRHINNVVNQLPTPHQCLCFTGNF